MYMFIRFTACIFDSDEKCVDVIMITVRPEGWLAKCQKLERCDFLGHYEYDNCQTLHDGSTH